MFDDLVKQIQHHNEHVLIEESRRTHKRQKSNFDIRIEKMHNQLYS